MIRAVLLTLLLIPAIAACTEPALTTAGFVVDVKSTSLTQVDSFTLRTPTGAETMFLVGPLELDGGAFPAGHLREHLALNQPVAVAYRDDGINHVAHRLMDAPWLQP